MYAGKDDIVIYTFYNTFPFIFNFFYIIFRRQTEKNPLDDFDFDDF